MLQKAASQSQRFWSSDGHSKAMHSTHQLSLAALALLVVLAGCAPQAPVVGDEPVGNPTQVEPGPRQQGEPDGEQQPSDEQPQEVLSACESSERGQTQTIVQAQTGALGGGDFELAYSYATPGFQSAVSLDQFAGLIAASYQPLLGNADLEFGNCLIDQSATRVALDVVVRTTQGEALGLRYVLLDTDDGWRVDGASDFRLVGTPA